MMPRRMVEGLQGYYLLLIVYLTGYSPAPGFKISQHMCQNFKLKGVPLFGFPLIFGLPSNSFFRAQAIIFIELSYASISLDI
jgi:hypothetical protein